MALYTRLNQYTPTTTNRDEYYTTLEEVEYIFNNIQEDFTNKIIYCPFDTEKSAFVQYIKANKSKLKYKDFWYTSDDWYNHKDLIQKADYIISNPPFSQLMIHKPEKDGILENVKNKKFFLFGHLITVVGYIAKFYPNVTVFKSRPPFKFRYIDGTYKNVGACIYITNLQTSLPMRRLELTKTTEQLKNENKFIIANNKVGQEGLFISRLKDMPIDYYDYMWVPLSFVLNDEISNYEFDGEFIKNSAKTTYRMLNIKSFQKLRVKRKPNL